MHHKLSASILFAIVVLSLGLWPTIPAAASPQGTLITVTTTADEYGTGAACSLREALRAANFDLAYGGCPAGNGADTIQLSGGEYKISAAQADSFRVQSNITLQGAGAANTFIDGNHLDTVLFVASGPLTLTQLAIRNADGHGIHIQGSGVAVILNEVDVYQNTAASDSGGGIYNTGLLTVNRSRIYENTAVAGGGILNLGTLTINNSMLSNNTASSGGGLHNQPARGVTISGSTINGNRATSPADVSKNGGGLYNNQGSIVLINSTLSGNTADGYGGGLYNDDGGAGFYNATIVENIADNDRNNFGTGGGIYNYTPYSNTSVFLGVRNTILARNYNAEAVGTSVDNCRGAEVTSEGYNILGTLHCSLGGDTTGNQGGNPLLTPLGNYGGFTLVHALNAGSAAIDTGNPNGCRNNNNIMLFRDQRGALRPIDGDENGDARCDIGAYEYVPLKEMFLPVVVK